MLFQLLSIYFRGYLNYVINFTSHESLAFKKLIATSFEIRQNDRYKIKTLFSNVLTVIKAPVLKNAASLKPVVIYDVDPSSAELRFRYVRELKGYDSEKEFSFLSAKQLKGFFSIRQKLIFVSATMPVILSVLLIALFKTDRSGLSQVYSNLLVSFNALKVLRQNAVKECIFFSAYDTNSTFLAVLLQRYKIKVTVVPSEVPLYKWNSILIADDLVLCSPYQNVELSYLPGVVYKTKHPGFPETAPAIRQLYTKQQPFSLKMGFISTGGWVREKLGHIEQGTGLRFNEERILNDLSNILNTRPHIELILYPHPRELNYYEGDIGRLKQYYQTFLGNTNFNISDTSLPSNQRFDEVYLALAYMSTLIFERAYFKRRSAIVYFKENLFPLPYEDEYLRFVSTKTELASLVDLIYGPLCHAVMKT